MNRIRNLGLRWLQHHNVRYVCVAVLATTVVLLAVSFGTVRGGMTIFGTGLGADYAGFYGAGTILNKYSAARLYDLGLQDELRHRAMPGVPAEARLPFRGYPPLVAVCFRPLALLPYAWSYFVWLIISAGFYVAGFALIRKTMRSVPSAERFSVLLLTLSFEPFLIEAWVGGQLSVVGFFCIALALYCEDRRLPIASGVALAFCLYKPTLLLLILPLLLVGHRFEMLSSFCLSGLLLAGACVLSVGKQPCLEYIRMLSTHLHDVTQGATVFRDWKYVDLLSAVRLLSGGNSWPGWLVVVSGFSTGCFCLAVAWWKSKGWDADRRRLLWACTLTGTLVVNVYVGIYDTVLVVIAALLTADVLYRRAGDQARTLDPAFKIWLVLIYVVPWFSQTLAHATGVQLYTVVLAGFGAYQFSLAGISRVRLESQT